MLNNKVQKEIKKIIHLFIFFKLNSRYFEKITFFYFILNLNKYHHLLEKKILKENYNHLSSKLINLNSNKLSLLQEEKKTKTLNSFCSYSANYLKI